MPYLLGLDAGTTSIKAWLYDAASGRPVAGASHPTPGARPRPGWAEHDPEALWLAAAASIRSALAAASPNEPVAALAVASMAEAGLPLDIHGRPLYPIIAYYDQRTDQYAGWWRERLGAEAIHAISGQVVRPPFGVMKLLWLRDQRPDLFARMRRWLSVGDYLIWRLAGVYATDRTLASRTMLFDQRALAWSPELIELAGIPRDILPDVHPSGAIVGAVHQDAAAQTGLAAGTPVATGGHDHLCGAFAAGVVAPGDTLASLGTAAALLAADSTFHGGGAVFAQGLSCYCHVADGAYVVQGGLGAAGAALAWLARFLRGANEPGDYAALEQAAIASPPGARGLVWLPHLRGSGTPERDSDSRAALIGLRDEHTPGDTWRAMIESLAYWSRSNLAAIEAATGRPAQRLTLIGGVARNALLPQIFADVIGRPVALLDIAEASARGAALLSAQAIGASIGPPPRPPHEVAPDLARAARYDRIYQEIYTPLYTALRPMNQALQAISGSGRE